MLKTTAWLDETTQHKDGSKTYAIGFSSGGHGATAWLTVDAKGNPRPGHNLSNLGLQDALAAIAKLRKS